MQIGGRRRSGVTEPGLSLSLPIVLLILIIVPQLSYFWLHKQVVQITASLEEKVIQQQATITQLQLKISEIDGIKSSLQEAQLTLRDAADLYRNSRLKISAMEVQSFLGADVVSQGAKRLLDVAADSQNCQQETERDVPAPLVAEYFGKVASGGGVYVDVGAGDGVFNSQTLYFDKVLCWKGVALEPALVEFPKLKINRPRAVTLNAALCEQSGRRVFSDITSDGKWTGWSGFQDTFSEKKRREVEKVLNYGDGWQVSEYQVECVTAVELFKELDTKHIDFMVVSVEGHEIEALRGIPADIEIDVIMVDIHHRPQEIQDLMTNRRLALAKKMDKSWIFVRQAFLDRE